MIVCVYEIFPHQNQAEAKYNLFERRFAGYHAPPRMHVLMSDDTNENIEQYKILFGKDI